MHRETKRSGPPTSPPPGGTPAKIEPADKDRIKQLEMALQFYADPRTWTATDGYPVEYGSEDAPIIRDGGNVARWALENSPDKLDALAELIRRS